MNLPQWIRNMTHRPPPPAEDNPEMQEVEARLDAALARLNRERRPYDDRLRNHRTRRGET